jgi:hypothetical protein
MASNILSWALSGIFLVLGVLNMILVHAVPGIFYLVLSVIYSPPTNTLLKTKLGFSIPFTAKVILGLFVLWGTLAVTDLADILGL